MQPNGANKNNEDQAIFSNAGPYLKRPDDTNKPSVIPKIYKLKNRKNINNVQRKFHEDQNQIKDIAVQNALKKLKDGSKPEDKINGLAEEIASKNAFHVSKILDQSFSPKKRDN